MKIVSVIAEGATLFLCFEQMGVTSTEYFVLGGDLADWHKLKDQTPFYGLLGRDNDMTDTTVDEARIFWEKVVMAGFTEWKPFDSLPGYIKKSIMTALSPDTQWVTMPLPSLTAGGGPYVIGNSNHSPWMTVANSTFNNSPNLEIKDATGDTTISLSDMDGIRVRVAQNTFISIEKRGICLVDKDNPANDKVLFPFPTMPVIT
jgi:hypothetical protein